MVQSIDARPGRQFNLQIGNGVSPTTFLQYAGLRNTQLTINNNPVDVTNVASNGFREWLPNGGVMDLAIQADGIMDDPTAAAAAQVQSAVNNRTIIEARVISGHGDSYAGDFVIMSFARTGAFDGAETFQISMSSDTQPIYHPA